MLIALAGLLAWFTVCTLVVGLCQMAARGDDALLGELSGDAMAPADRVTVAA